MLIPPRSSATELLDAAPPADATLVRNLHEMAALHRLTGGARLAWRGVNSLLDTNQSRYTLLDVAAGNGWLVQHLAQRAATHGIRVQPYISDAQPNIVRIARVTCLPNTPVLVHDGLHAPFADRSFDVVHCSQALHHFEPTQAVALLRECARIARRGIVFTDLRRSWVGYWGARLVALGPLTPLGRSDGPLSVLRAYTVAEVRELAAAADLQRVSLRTTPIHWMLVGGRQKAESRTGVGDRDRASEGCG